MLQNLKTFTLLGRRTGFCQTLLTTPSLVHQQGSMIKGLWSLSVRAVMEVLTTE